MAETYINQNNLKEAESILIIIQDMEFEEQKALKIFLTGVQYAKNTYKIKDAST